jgi:dynein heavy chain, axonemal
VRLTEQLDGTRAELKSLEDQAAQCKKRLRCAGVLLASLAGEAGRWKATAAELKEDLSFIVGHVLLASAYVSYMGPFSEFYRSRILREWLDASKSAGLLVSDHFSMQHVLSSDLEVRTWWLQVGTYNSCQNVLM